MSPTAPATARGHSGARFYASDPASKTARRLVPSAGRGFDKNLYKPRSVVERLIGQLKEYRRIATRYDKLAETFRCFVLIGFIRIWLKDLLLDRAQNL